MRQKYIGMPNQQGVDLQAGRPNDLFVILELVDNQYGWGTELTKHKHSITKCSCMYKDTPSFYCVLQRLLYQYSVRRSGTYINVL